MCYFLELAIPEQNKDALALLSSREFQTCQERETELAKHIPSKFITVSLLSHGCSCDLYRRSGQKRDLDKERMKYKKKGWSEAKIERALEGKQSDDEQKESLRADIKQAITNLLNKVDQLYVLFHWIDDDVKGTQQLSKVTFVDGNMLINENQVVLVS